MRAALGWQTGWLSNPKPKLEFDLKTGKAEVKGNHAVVPTSSVCKMKGVTLNLNGRIVLIKQKGVWKWDLTSNDTGEIEKASAQVFMVRPPTKK